jgi:hypothetical protein
VLGDFEMSDFPLAELAKLGLGRNLARAKANPSQDDLSQPLVWQADDLDLCDLGMRVEKFFDFARVDVLAAADNQSLARPVR